MPPIPDQLQFTGTQLKVLECVFDVWMQLPRATRKDSSYDGALFRRIQSDPVDFTRTYGGAQYFDPGNEVYASSLESLLPEWCSRSELNNESLGDLVEGILGYAWMKRQISRGCDWPGRSFVHALELYTYISYTRSSARDLY